MGSQIEEKNSCPTYGIQGGRGSFNEAAFLQYAKSHGINKYKIKYLYTTERVLKSLCDNKIDYGQFAIHNSTGGLVDESLEAIGKYNFKILDKFGIYISHTLMIHPEAKIKDITTVMTHPQVLAQCKQNLAKKYPQLILTSGEGELIDHAKVAQFLHKGKLPKHIATMGSKILCEIYNLTAVEENLQDDKKNYTSFLIVTKE